MRVLLYSPLAVLGHHFETDLEIAEGHLQAGDEVFLIRCSGQLKPLHFMACQGVLRCQLCKSRHAQGIAKLSNRQNLKVIDIGSIQSIPCTEGSDLISVNGIKAVQFEDVDVGSAYVSSLISDLRDPQPELKSREQETREAIHYLAGLKKRFDGLLDTIKPDRTYFFNGRFCMYRPLLRVCQQRGLEFYVHERGANNTLYSLTKNNLPHDIETVRQAILQRWQNNDRPMKEKRQQASQWYERKASGHSLAWRSFTDQQDVNALPAGWDSKKTNVAFFVSSEDEFAAIPGWEFTFFESQAQAIGYVSQYFSKDPNFAFFVRLHPNLRGLNNPTINALKELESKFPNCKVISSESSVSTYTLIQKAKKVVSFGSTVGVEATYWQTPSILAGRSFYGALNACYLPNSLNELVDLIKDPNLKPIPQEGALMYGYWISTMGYPFRYYQAMNLTTGAFQGVVLTGFKPFLWLNYFFAVLKDLKKIFKGEYSMWHLREKIRYKLRLLKKA